MSIICKIDEARSFVINNLNGKGLEIGASHNPLPYNTVTTKMLYQDRLFLEERQKEVELFDKAVNPKDIIEPDIVSEADKIPEPDESFDFVCNSHLLEHLENPIKAIHEWLRVIKKGGIIYLIVPDMRFTFDKNRKLTPLKHLIDDYVKNMNEVKFSHYADYCSNVEHEKLENAEEYFAAQTNIHVHTFTYASLLELLDNLEKHLGFNIVDHKLIGMDICVVLMKK